MVITALLMLIFNSNIFINSEKFIVQNGILNAEAGKCYNFTVVSRDKMRNKLLKGGNDYEVYTNQVQQYQHFDSGAYPLSYDSITKSFVSHANNNTSLLTTLSTEPSSTSSIRYGEVFNHQNGNYSMQICPIVAGVHEMYVLLNGKGVSNQPYRINQGGVSGSMVSGRETYIGQYVDMSPYTLIVHHSSPFALTSTATGSGLSNATVGVPASFLLTIRDSYDNIVNTNTFAYLIAIFIDQSPSASIETTSFHNGSILVQYIAQTSSWNRLNVLIDGIPIAGSPYHVFVIDGLYSANYSFAVGQGLNLAIAGEISYFEVYSYDIYGNRKSTTSEMFWYNITGSNNLTGCMIPCIVADTCDDTSDTLLGRYSGSYIPTNAGVSILSVYQVDNCSSPLYYHEISNSPYHITVIPNTAAANMTIVRGAIYDNIAGEIGVVNILLRDVYGNRLQVGGNYLDLRLQWIANPSYGMHVDAPIIGNIIDMGYGEYIAHYNATVAGQYDLVVYVAEARLSVSYYDRYYRVGEYIGLYRTYYEDDVHIPSLLSSQQRYESFSCRYDGLIQPEHVELYVFKISIDSSSMIRLYIGEAYPGDTISNLHPMKLVLEAYEDNHGSGSYSFQSMRPHRIMIEYSHRDGDPMLLLSWQSSTTKEIIIPSSAFMHWTPAISYTTTIHQSSLSSITSTASGQALYHAEAGEEAIFQIEARDAYGNILGSGGDDPTAFIVSAYSNPIRAVIDDHGDGRYTASYIATVTGNYRLYVTIGCCPSHPAVGVSEEILQTASLLVAGSPFELKVTPNTILPSHSKAEGVGLSGGYVGNEHSFRIIYRDYYGNPTTISDSNISVEALFYDTSRSVQVKPSYVIVDVSSSSYAIVRYNMTTAGTFALYLRVIVGNNSDEIEQSTYQATFYPIQPHPSTSRIRGYGLSQAIVHATSSFDIMLYDVYCNRITSGAYAFYARLIGDTDSLISLPIILSCEYMNSDNVYHCTFQPTYPGPHNLTIQLLNTSFPYPDKGSGLWASYYATTIATASSKPIYRTLSTRVSISSPTGFLLPDLISAKVEAQVDNNDNIIIESSGASVRYDGYILIPHTDTYAFRVVSQNVYSSIYLDQQLIWDSDMDDEAYIMLNLFSNTSCMISISMSVIVPGHAVSATMQWKPASSRTWLSLPSQYLYIAANDVANSPYKVIISI